MFTALYLKRKINFISQTCIFMCFGIMKYGDFSVGDTSKILVADYCMETVRHGGVQDWACI